MPRRHHRPDDSAKITRAGYRTGGRYRLRTGGVVQHTAAGQAGPSRMRNAVGEVLVTYVPTDHINLMAFLTSEHPENEIEPSCHADIARKRNVGLLLGRLCGWRTIMFLDDDIRDMTANAVSQAAAMTAHYQAVGFRIASYPDNSVVCHAHRLAGGLRKFFRAAAPCSLTSRAATRCFLRFITKTGCSYSMPRSTVPSPWQERFLSWTISHSHSLGAPPQKNLAT